MSGADDIKKLGTILSVWAHPDDETFSAGGLLTAAVRGGQTVACVTATKGEAGVHDPEKWPVDHTGEIREKELQDAMQLLGITKHHWLDYKDGQCENAPKAEAVARIVGYIEKYKPDTIVTFAPDGMTGHPDHCCVSAWVSEAVKQSGLPIVVLQVVHTPRQYEEYLKVMDEKLNIFYKIDKPRLVPESECALHYVLPDDICKLKCEALRSMPSQTDSMFEKFDQDFLCKAFCSEAFIKA